MRIKGVDQRKGLCIGSLGQPLDNRLLSSLRLLIISAAEFLNEKRAKNS